MGGRLWLQTYNGAVRVGSVAALDVHHHPPLPERGTGYDTADTGGHPVRLDIVIGTGCEPLGRPTPRAA